MSATLSAIDANALSFAATYVAMLVLLGLVLTAGVISVRRSQKVGIGDGGNHTLARRIRVHGNFSEQAPLILALLVMLPLLGAREWLVHAVGLTGLVGRILHAIGLGKSIGPSFGRVAGMLLTWASLAIGVVGLLVLAWR